MLYTPLYTLQQKNKRIEWCEQAGWKLPLHYGCSNTEHQAVRKSVGVFDLSYMGVIDVTGEHAVQLLSYVLANDIRKLRHNGQAFYSCLLNENAGIIDDCIVYRINSQHFRLVVNVTQVRTDTIWLQQHVGRWEKVACENPSQLSMLSIQGPRAVSTLLPMLPDNIAREVCSLKPFCCFSSQDWLLARTGYSGEDGMEVILPSPHAHELWVQLISQQVQACGLMARDSLRIEAGFNAYGREMHEGISPLTCNLKASLSLSNHKRIFIGRKALEKQLREGIKVQQWGVLIDKQVPVKTGDALYINQQERGIITSSAYSPVLDKQIALVQLPIALKQSVSVKIEGEFIPVTVVKPPFVRRGKSMFEIIGERLYTAPE